MNKSKKPLPKGCMRVTTAQLNAIVNAADMLSAMLGVGTDFDIEAKKTVRMIDQFLKQNGLKRLHN